MSLLRISHRPLTSFLLGYVCPKKKTSPATVSHVVWRTFSMSTSISPSSATTQPVVLPSSSSPIDFDTASSIIGAESHALLVQLEPGQVLRAETGAMLFMTSGIDMNTSLGGNQGISSGFKRMITGQNLFISDFTYSGPIGTKGTVGLGTDFPSKILRFSLKDYGHKLVCQKGAFLAGSANVQIEMEFTKSFMSGFFGSEGFILQALLGDDDVFCKAGGTVIKKELKQGETLRVSSGSLVAFTQEIQYDITLMPGFKNVLFGGEGLFITTLQGPGTVWLQGMSPDRMISEIVRRIPSGGGFGLPIPIPLGGGGGEGSSSSPNGESVSVEDKVETPIVSDAPSPNEPASNVESESPSALFGDAVSTQTSTKDTFAQSSSASESTDEHYTSSTATDNNFIIDETSKMPSELPEEEMSEEDVDRFEIEQSAGESQDDNPIGLFRKIWDFFRGDD